MRTGHALVIAITLLGCGGKHEEKPAPGSGSAAPQVAVKPAGVQIFVDDTAVATVDPAQVASWPRIDSLVPETARRLGTWQAIHIKGAKPTVSELDKPFETYRDSVPALFPGEGGTISFGIFDPVELGKQGKPALREDGVTELRVKLDASGMRGGNDHGGGEPIDPAKVELVIKTATEERKLSGVNLLALPREGMPGGGGDAKGWQIPQVLAAAGVKTFKKILLTDAGGTSLTLESKELDASTIPFLKLNRQGALRFRLYKKQGEGWQAAGDLRSLVKIDVLE